MSPNKNNRYSDHYILPSVSAEAHVKRNRCEHPLRNTDTPRIVCDLHLQEVPLTLVNVRLIKIMKIKLCTLIF